MEDRTWYSGTVTGYLTEAEHSEALELAVETGQPVHMLVCSEAEAEEELEL